MPKLAFVALLWCYWNYIDLIREIWLTSVHIQLHLRERNRINLGSSVNSGLLIIRLIEIIVFHFEIREVWLP
jgi:hypothetical protein